MADQHDLIDWSLPPAELSERLMTRDERRVRIYAVDHPDKSFCVIGSHETGSTWILESWTKDGRAECDKDNNLILRPPPPRKFRFERWVNVQYVSSNGTFALWPGHFLSKEVAEDRADEIRWPHCTHPNVVQVRVIIEGEFP